MPYLAVGMPVAAILFVMIPRAAPLLLPLVAVMFAYALVANTCKPIAESRERCETADQCPREHLLSNWQSIHESTSTQSEALARTAQNRRRQPLLNRLTWRP
jgi:hypothetical protein